MKYRFWFLLVFAITALCLADCLAFLFTGNTIFYRHETEYGHIVARALVALIGFIVIFVSVSYDFHCGATLVSFKLDEEVNTRGIEFIKKFDQHPIAYANSEREEKLVRYAFDLGWYKAFTRAAKLLRGEE